MRNVKVDTLGHVRFQVKDIVQFRKLGELIRQHRLTIDLLRFTIFTANSLAEHVRAQPVAIRQFCERSTDLIERVRRRQSDGQSQLRVGDPLEVLDGPLG